MNYNCKWLEVVLLLLIIIWAIWANLFGIPSFWVIIVAAVILLIHELGCKNCHVNMKAKPKKKAKKKK